MKKQAGFSAIELAMAVVILGLIGAVTWQAVAGHIRNTAAKVTPSPSPSASVKVTHTPSPTPLGTDAATPAPVTHSNSTVTITIPEVRIKFTAPSDLADLVWKAFGQQAVEGVYFSSKTMIAMDNACSADQGALGLIQLSNYSADQREAQGEGDFGQVVATLQHMYLYYQSPQGPCSSNSSVMAKESQLDLELKQSLASAQLY